LANVFVEGYARVFFEVVEDHVKVEHVITGLLLVGESQFGGQGLVLALVEDLVDELHKFESGVELLGLGSRNPELFELFLHVSVQHVQIQNYNPRWLN
jgi:hypothetical protein